MATSKRFLDETGLSLLWGKIQGAFAPKSHVEDKNNPHEVTATQVGAVPNTIKINNKALTSDITLTADDVNARPSTWTPSASDIGAVSTDTTINGKALSSNVTLSASDIGARPADWTPSASDLGLENVGNYKAVSTVANQGLSTTEQANARANIGAGTSTAPNDAQKNVQSDWNATSGDAFIKNKPTIPTVTDTYSSASSAAMSGKAVASAIDGITAADVNARPDNWTPTASEVGARPDTWVPTAAEVGAVPTSTTINGKALTENITLDASDVGIDTGDFAPMSHVEDKNNPHEVTAAQIGALTEEDIENFVRTDDSELTDDIINSYELISNKVTDIEGNEESDEKYPSAKAVVDYVSAHSSEGDFLPFTQHMDPVSMEAKAYYNGYNGDMGGLIVAETQLNNDASIRNSMHLGVYETGFRTYLDSHDENPDMQIISNLCNFFDYPSIEAYEDNDYKGIKYFPLTNERMMFFIDSDGVLNITYGRDANNPFDLSIPQ